MSIVLLAIVFNSILTVIFYFLSVFMTLSARMFSFLLNIIFDFLLILKILIVKRFNFLLTFLFILDYFKISIGNFKSLLEYFTSLKLFKPFIYIRPVEFITLHYMSLYLSYKA